jgi:hypothetical protein
MGRPLIGKTATSGAERQRMERRLAGVGNTVTDDAARIRALEQQVAELRA